MINGCWAGHRIPDAKLVDKHSCVRWVYKSGGQLGVFFIYIFPVPNNILCMEYAEDRLIITEGELNNEFVSAPWKASFALNLQTGEPTPVFLKHDVHRYNSPEKWDLKNGRFDYSTNNNLRVVVKNNDMFIGKFDAPIETYTKILKLKDSGDPAIFSLLPNDVMVFQIGSNYIVCVDMKKLPEYESLLQSSDSCLDKK
jgi:hypothetical protein